MTQSLLLVKRLRGLAGLVMARTGSMINTNVCTFCCFCARTNCVSVIIFENGKSGFMGEHSCMDGTPTLRMNEFALASLATKKVDLGPPRTSETGKGLPTPAELKFVVNETLSKHVADAEIAFNKLVGKHDMHVCALLRVPHRGSHFLCQVLHYEGYGKGYIKKFNLSPDAWAQLVKQLAFHKMFGRPGVCYESAQTRRYQLGRTEVIRSASNESKAWVEAMLNPKETVSIFPLTDRLCFSNSLNRIPIVPLCLKGLSLDMCNTPFGLLMVRVSIATCLV